MINKEYLTHIIKTLSTTLQNHIHSLNTEKDKWEVSNYYTTFQQEELLHKSYETHKTEIQKLFTNITLENKTIAKTKHTNTTTLNTLSAIATIIATCEHYKHIDLETYHGLDNFIRKNITFYKNTVEDLLFNIEIKEKKENEEKLIESYLKESSKNLYEFLETVYLLSSKSLENTEQLLLHIYDATIEENNLLDTKNFICSAKEIINNKENTRMPITLLANIIIPSHIITVTNDYNCDIQCNKYNDLCDNCKKYKELLTCKHGFQDKHLSMFEVRNDVLKNIYNLG